MNFGAFEAFFSFSFLSPFSSPQYTAIPVFNAAARFWRDNQIVAMILALYCKK